MKMLDSEAPIAAENSQNIACDAVLDSRLMPKLSTSTNASGAKIAAKPSTVGCGTA